MMGVCLKLPDLQLTYSQFSWNVMAAVGKAQGLGGGEQEGITNDPNYALSAAMVFYLKIQRHGRKVCSFMFSV